LGDIALWPSLLLTDAQAIKEIGEATLVDFFLNQDFAFLLITVEDHDILLL
jgi:hypothetical protein